MPHPTKLIRPLRARPGRTGGLTAPLRSPVLKPWHRPKPRDFPSAFETPDDVEQLDVGRRLCLTYEGSEAALELAKAMTPDASANRVRFSMASARAVRVARLRLIKAALPVFEPCLRQPGGLRFVTLMLPGWYAPLGELQRLNARRICGLIKTRIKRIVARNPGLEGGIIVGMFEIAMRLYKGEHAGYQLHLHAACDERGYRALSCLPRRRFGAGPERVWQPYLALDIPDEAALARRLGYVLKAQARTWDPHRTFSKSTGQAGPVWQHELPPDRIAESLIWMDRWRLCHLILVTGTYDLRSAMSMNWICTYRD